MRPAVIVVLALCVPLAACSSSSKSASSTTSAPATTVAVSRTTAASTTASLPGNIPATIQESAYVVAVDQSARTITIDPMEYLTGAPADAAYRKAYPTAEIKSPPDDYFIVNPTKDRVALPLDPTFDAEVLRTGDTVHASPVPITVAQLGQQPQLEHRPFWITVERGVATRAVEQYIP